VCTTQVTEYKIIVRSGRLHVHALVFVIANRDEPLLYFASYGEDFRVEG
jgi:hypothetical protein